MKIIVTDKDHPFYGELCIMTDRQTPISLSVTCFKVNDNDGIGKLIKSGQFVEKETFDACQTIIASKLLFGNKI